MRSLFAGLPRSTLVGVAITLLMLLGASLAGGLVVAISLAGRTLPTSASIGWLGAFLGASLLLLVWGLLYAHYLHHRVGVPSTRSFLLAALCHVPLLAGLGLVQAVYASDTANHVYSTSVLGQIVYRPLALMSVVLAPAMLQMGLAALLLRSRLAASLAVALPLAIALALRLWSLDWQLPYLLHNDERGYLASATIAWAHGDPNPHRFLNPSVMFYINTALFNLLGGERAEAFRVFAEAFGQQLWDPRGNYMVVLALRGVVALMGTGTVLLAYLAGKQLLGKRAALFAAWFLAVSFLHVRNSHYGTNDVAATFFAAASFLFVARVYRFGRWSDYLWAGALGGLATSTKYNVGLFVLPLLVVHLARQKGPDAGRRSLPERAAPLLASYAVSGLTFVLGTPYSILDWERFVAGFTRQVAYGAAPWVGQEVLPSWWLQLAGLAHGFGLIPLLLAAVGALCLVRRSPWTLALVAAFPVGYYLFMCGHQLYFARFSIPMLPFVALIAGGGMAWLAGRVGLLPGGRLLVPCLLAMALAQPAVYSVQSNLVMGRADTRVLADRWISENVPPGGLLLVDGTSDLRLSQGWPSRSDLVVQMFDPFKEPDPWRPLSRRPVYLAVTSFGYDGFRRGAGGATDLPEPYRQIDEAGELVALFHPGQGERPVRYSIDDTYTPFWHMMEHARPGPTVRIYRFDR